MGTLPKVASELGRKRGPAPRNPADLARVTRRGCRHLLKQGDVVGCMIFYSGDMVMFRNGYDLGDGPTTDDGTGVPATRNLYPVVDLLGTVEEVRG